MYPEEYDEYVATCRNFFKLHKGKKYKYIYSFPPEKYGTVVEIMGMHGSNFIITGATFSYITSGIDDIVFDKRTFYEPYPTNIWEKLEEDFTKLFCTSSQKKLTKLKS